MSARASVVKSSYTRHSAGVYAFRGRRKLSLIDLRLVTDQAKPVAGEQAIAAAGGRACFDKFVDSCQGRLGIDVHEDLTEGGQTLQVRSVCTDGANCSK